jgi:hypothetical protein
MIRLLPLLILLAGCRSTRDCETVEWEFKGEVRQEVIRTPTLWENIQAFWYFSR